MATKSITITNDAYEKLASFKGPKESFSDVVNKLTSRYSLLDLVGLLRKDEADFLKKHIKDMDKKIRRNMKNAI